VLKLQPPPDSRLFSLSPRTGKVLSESETKMNTLEWRVLLYCSTCSCHRWTVIAGLKSLQMNHRSLLLGLGPSTSLAFIRAVSRSYSVGFRSQSFSGDSSLSKRLLVVGIRVVDFSSGLVLDSEDSPGSFSSLLDVIGSSSGSDDDDGIKSRLAEA
jgi:hypothetical protein